MGRWHKVSRLSLALLTFAISITAAIPQTRTGTTSTSKKPPSTTRAIPNIKCTDPQSMAACKSFKQLVEVRDKRILDILIGTHSAPAMPSGYRRHIAYICPRQKLDEFWTVDFDEPTGKSYEPYSYYLSQGEVEKRLEEGLAFQGPPPPNRPVDLSIQDQWFEEHLNWEVYDFGEVNVHDYADGLHSDWEEDYGKWSRPSETQNDPTSDDAANFESAYEWLERHTGNDKDSPDIGDDPEHAHISIVDGEIHIHYLFETKTGAHINNELNIQESTGRFTQTFFDRELPSLGNIESNGTCMIFKQ